MTARDQACRLRRRARRADGALRRATVAAAVLLFAVPARAEPRLEVHPALDATVTAVGGSAWVASEVLKGSLASSRCRWCDRDGLGRDTLNGFDAATRDALVWRKPAVADAISNGTGFALAPVVTLGGLALAARLDDQGSQAWQDGLVSLEAAVLAADLNQAAKFAFARERPFVHAMDPSQRGRSPDENLSFFSGHTTLAFSLATSAGTIASMRRRKLAPAVWAVGLGVGALTGWLRIAADKHYATDVLTGAAIGSLVGFCVPWFFHSPARTNGAVAWTLVGVPGGLGVGGTY